ncbi:hypothetical protein GGX14DRAFT_430537 [Mycena pura]|uniref:Senescence domain-containing protein n=1 Tax=Mycena pura TaxID=153505 RepID=A0AAD6VXD7_9AGAR|nr:hypothetical protein GGX14DRAFT_430537 [Mycena pura]
MTSTDAFVLLNLSSCSLAAIGMHQSGTLALECVTIQVPGALTSGDDRHIYLVLRMDQTEIPIDPNRTIRTDLSDPGSRKYTFMPSDTDPVELILTVTLPNVPDAHFLEDVEIFESILAQYADLQGAFEQATTEVVPNINDKAASEELRGHLVLVNEDSGEVVGEFDRHFSVREDPALGKTGHENDPVVIEILDDEAHDANAMELFARAIPPEQQDWITKGATVISHAISGSTTLLLTAISAGSAYYTSHSKSSAQRAASARSASPAGTPGTAPLPPRAVAFLSSARTRKGLAAVHSVSGEAVKISTKTMEKIDRMIKNALGSSKRQGKSPARMPATLPPPLPPRTPSPSFLGPPPPYSSSLGTAGPSASGEKPHLPPRRQPSPSSSSVPPALPPRKISDHAAMPAPTGERVVVNLSTKTRILLSADLILATMDNSMRRILDSGTENLGSVVGHKYGPEAAESSVLMAGTARNVALVYIDLRGIGRKAILRRAGKEFMRGMLNKPEVTKVQS